MELADADADCCSTGASPTRLRRHRAALADFDSALTLPTRPPGAALPARTVPDRRRRPDRAEADLIGAEGSAAERGDRRAAGAGISTMTVSARTFVTSWPAWDAGRGRQHGRRAGGGTARPSAPSSHSPWIAAGDVRRPKWIHRAPTDPRQHALCVSILASGQRRPPNGSPATRRPVRRGHRAVGSTRGRRALGWLVCGRSDVVEPGSHRADRPRRARGPRSHGADRWSPRAPVPPTRCAGERHDAQSSLLNLTSRGGRAVPPSSQAELVIGVLKVVGHRPGDSPAAPRSGVSSTSRQQHDIPFTRSESDRSRHGPAGESRAFTAPPANRPVLAKGCRRVPAAEWWRGRRGGGLRGQHVWPKPSKASVPVRGRPFVVGSPRAATATTATRSPPPCERARESGLHGLAAPSRAAS